MEYFPKPFAIISEGTKAHFSQKKMALKSPLKQKWFPSSPSLQNQAGISLSHITFFIHGKNRLLSKYQHGVDCNVQVNSKLIFFRC